MQCEFKCEGNFKDKCQLREEDKCDSKWKGNVEDKCEIRRERKCEGMHDSNFEGEYEGGCKGKCKGWQLLTADSEAEGTVLRRPVDILHSWSRCHLTTCWHGPYNISQYNNITTQ